MANELLDILSDNSGEYSKEKLLQYLNKELPPEEMRTIEKALLDSPMLNDALEGLQEIQQNKRLPEIEKEIDNRLQQYLNKRKARKSRHSISDMSWIYITIIIIIVLLLIGYLMVTFEGGAK